MSDHQNQSNNQGHLTDNLKSLLQDADDHISQSRDLLQDLKKKKNNNIDFDNSDLDALNGCLKTNIEFIQKLEIPEPTVEIMIRLEELNACNSLFAKLSPPKNRITHGL